uniref:Uncharacterized protein isoform X1 n=1 Tax=Pogona vitticeps TaxID=103695 RepID=A0ABM5F7C0_9SAUR
MDCEMDRWTTWDMLLADDARRLTWFDVLLGRPWRDPPLPLLMRKLLGPAAMMINLGITWWIGQVACFGPAGRAFLMALVASIWAVLWLCGWLPKDTPPEPFLLRPHDPHRWPITLRPLHKTASWRDPQERAWPTSIPASPPHRVPPLRHETTWDMLLAEDARRLTWWDLLLGRPWRDPPLPLLMRKLLGPAAVMISLGITWWIGQVACFGPAGRAFLMVLVASIWAVLWLCGWLPKDTPPEPLILRPHDPHRLTRRPPITLPPLETTAPRASWRDPRPERTRQPFTVASPPRRVPPLRLSPARPRRPRPLSSNPFSPDRLRLLPVSPAPFYSGLFSPAPFCPTCLNPIPYFPAHMHPLPMSPAPFSPAPFFSAPMQSLPISPAQPNPLPVSPALQNPLPIPPASFPPAPQNPLPMASVPFPPAPQNPLPMTSAPFPPAPQNPLPMTSAPFPPAPQNPLPMTSAPFPPAPRIPSLYLLPPTLLLPSLESGSAKMRAPLLPPPRRRLGAGRRHQEREKPKQSG